MSGKVFLAGPGHTTIQYCGTGPVFYAKLYVFSIFFIHSFTNKLLVYLLSIVLLAHLLCYHLFASYDTLLEGSYTAQ
jgi:hypothetical protein